MKFAIITQVPHVIEKGLYFSYAPYVKEMNIWIKYVDELTVVAPVLQTQTTAIDAAYNHSRIDFIRIPQIDLLSARAIVNTILKLPLVCLKIFSAMQTADHIHLRCPGNIGLLGCFIQILFPNKNKTAKYAGNWDPKASQPWSYKLQRWILSNTFLTRNMQVLVYGDWENSSANVKSFFTATYHDTDKVDVPVKPIDNQIKFLFVGTLSPGKRPLYAVELVERLNRLGYNATLDMYGDGKMRNAVESYIDQSKLAARVILHGNQSELIVRKAYQHSHFLLLPSQSEGWPKVVAEAMFWRCLPVATKISCLPFMLDQGKRGLLLNVKAEQDAANIAQLLDQPAAYQDKVLASMAWSRKYTLDLFDNEIKRLLTT